MRRPAKPGTKGDGGRESVAREPIDPNRRSVVDVQMHKTGLYRLPGGAEPGAGTGRMGARMMAGVMAEMAGAGCAHEPVRENETHQQGPHQPRSLEEWSARHDEGEAEDVAGAGLWIRATMS